MSNNYFLFLLLAIALFSCKNEIETPRSPIDPIRDTISGPFDEPVSSSDGRKNTISEYNSNIESTIILERPKQSILRNISIDTSQAFGIWVQYADAPNADFRLNKESFYVADYDGDGAMPYILDGRNITIFYNDFIQNGIIIDTSNDTLKIKWKDTDFVTNYIKFEN